MSSLPRAICPTLYRIVFSVLIFAFSSGTKWVSVSPRISNENSSEDLVAMQGETAVMICSASGYPRPKVAWYKLTTDKEKTRLPDTDTLNGETLTIRGVDRGDNGDYECVASNGVPPEATRKIKLTVGFLNVTGRIVNKLLTEAIVECHAVVYPTGEVYLKKDGKRISEDRRYIVETYNDNDDIIFRLYIRNLMEEDYGPYHCVATNYVSLSEKVFYLEGELPATMTPVNKRVAEGEMVVLLCDIDHVPQTNITWYKLSKLANGEKIRLANIEVQAEPGMKPDSFLSNLIIGNATLESGGLYQCVMSNGILQEASRKINLTVEHTPKVYIKTKKLNNTETAILECTVVSFLRVNVHWEKDKENISFGSNYFIGQYRHDNNITSSLIIKRLSKEGYGNYTCIASNGDFSRNQSVTINGDTIEKHDTIPNTAGQKDSQTATSGVLIRCPVISSKYLVTLIVALTVSRI